MKRLLMLAVCAAASAGCVSVQGMPDPHGALKPGQRLVVAVYRSPGPWIIGAADTKAEAAAKISPLGFLVQTAEDQHTLSVSKNLQQYLPRPHLGLALQESLLKALTVARSTGAVQTLLEAGIPELQLAEWNKSKDQLDWRERYYSPDPDSPAPRDYARVLTLDDALILDVNVSFGTDASDDGRLLPTMTADSRVYTGDNTHLLWEHEDVASDQSSSATMTDYQVQPWLLTDRLQKLAPALGTEIASSFLKAFSLAPSTSTSHSSHGAHGSHKMAPMGGGGGGLVSMSAFQHLSTAPAAGLAAAPPATAPAQSAPAISSSTAASVTVSSSAAALQALPGLAAPASVSTSAVSAAPPPAAPVSTSTAPAASPPR